MIFNRSRRKELKTILLLKGTNAELDKVLRNPQLSSNYQEGKNASKDAFDEMTDGMSVEPSFLQLIKEKKIDLVAQESLTLGAANSLLYTLKSQLAPFSIITCDSGLWEEKSAAVRLSNKQLKSKRNKHWKKKKRKYVAEMRLKVGGCVLKLLLFVSWRIKFPSLLWLKFGLSSILCLPKWF